MRKSVLVGGAVGIIGLTTGCESTGDPFMDFMIGGVYGPLLQAGAASGQYDQGTSALMGAYGNAIVDNRNARASRSEVNVNINTQPQQAKEYVTIQSNTQPRYVPPSSRYANNGKIPKHLLDYRAMWGEDDWYREQVRKIKYERDSKEFFNRADIKFEKQMESLFPDEKRE